MTVKITLAAVSAILLLAATTALVWAWPDQPPEKVLISGPDIEGQIEVKEVESRALFRLGYLEDFGTSAPARAPQGSTAYKIVRYFYGGDFDFARLTYYPNPSGDRGYLYFEDGPDLQGNHTAYHQKWLYPTKEGEAKLRVLLIKLGARLDSVDASNNPIPVNAVSNGYNTVSQTTTAPHESDAFASTVIPLSVGVLGLLGLAGALFLWLSRHQTLAN